MTLDGKVVAADIKQRLKEEIAATNKRAPYLVIITVGDDPASKVYVKNKRYRIYLSDTFFISGISSVFSRTNPSIFPYSPV